MKTNPALLPIAALLFGAALHPAFSQPAGLPQINPATGLPASAPGRPAKPPRIDPATGLAEVPPGELSPERAIHASYQVRDEVQKLLFNHRYEEALQRCLAFHKKWQTSASLIPLLNDWVELGRQYPKAKAALVELRDRDVREFSEGRGFFALFQEVSSLNSSLHEEDVTYELFKSLRNKDPRLAEQCAPEDLLVAKGEYQWCYDHMGDPQAKFDSIRQNLNMRLEQLKRSAELQENTRRRIAEENRRRGWTNLPAFSPPDTSARMKQWTEDSFIGQARQLVLVLVATGHKAEAEKIRAQALTVLDDARLKSAVTDAMDHTSKPPGPLEGAKKGSSIKGS